MKSKDLINYLPFLYLLIIKNTSVGILKVAPPSQMLFNKDSQLMEDDKTLAEYGLTSATAKAQCPAPIGLALRYIILKLPLLIMTRKLGAQ